MNENGSAPKAIKDALWSFEQAQITMYSVKPRKVTRIGINRPTWERLDRASRLWLREIAPDPYVTQPLYAHIIAGMVMIEYGGKHRVTRFRNATGSPDWLPLEEDVFLPDGMVELISDLPFSYETARWMVDITRLLEVSEAYMTLAKWGVES